MSTLLGYFLIEATEYWVDFYFFLKDKGKKNWSIKKFYKVLK